MQTIIIERISNGWVLENRNKSSKRFFERIDDLCKYIDNYYTKELNI